MQLLNKISRNRKKIFSLIFFFFLAISLPITSYFVTSEDAFDRRSEAAVFNALVADMEYKIETHKHIPGMIGLEFPKGMSDAEIERIIGRKRNFPEELRGTYSERVEFINVNVNDMAEEMATYQMYTPVQEVDLNHIYEPLWRADGANRVVPNDWNPSRHWSFNNIKLPEVWKIQGCLEGRATCGGDKNVTVAVLDTGLALNAPEVVGGMNVSPHTPSGMRDRAGRDPYGRYPAGHGTFVAGVIASATNNASSSVGMAHNLTILPLRSNPENGLITTEYVVRGISYASRHADVLNMSFGGSHPNTLQRNALNEASSRGLVLVAASGNSYRSGLNYPAAYPNVIAVGAVNPDNSRSDYSTYGSGLDFVAPVGERPNGTWHQSFSCMPTPNGCPPGSNFSSFSTFHGPGTSFAAPQVAGAAGLILSLDSSLSPAQVKQVLIDTVDNIGSRTQFGYGLLNLENIYKHFGEIPDPEDPDPDPDKYPKQVRAIYDLTGDGNGEILWQYDDGKVVAWNMNGVRKVREQVIATIDTAWEIKAIYDFTGDGNAEILFQHTDGRLSVWHMDGLNRVRARNIATVDTAWDAKAIYDFTGDGNAEILFQHTDGRLSVWYMDGLNRVRTENIATVDSGWDVKAVYDLTGNSNAEILLQHTNGRFDVWRMNGVQKSGESNVATVDSAWEIRDVYDITKNNRPDILWQHSDGRVTFWHMRQGGLTRENQTRIYPDTSDPSDPDNGNGDNGNGNGQPPSDGCSRNSDCRREVPYEICFVERSVCLKGDVNNDGSINMDDFEEFKKDFLSFRENGWGTNLRRSDFNQDRRISMADYSVFVNSYRLIQNLN